MVGGKSLPLNFDGWKCYFRIIRPTSNELKFLPRFVLTSELPYLPQRYVVARNLKTNKIEIINKWRRQLGYPTYAATNFTLNNTTQLVQSNQDETREYMRNYFKKRVWDLKPRHPFHHGVTRLHLLSVARGLPLAALHKCGKLSTPPR